jgi:RNA polymerase sigma factor (sigma-70 family)
MNVLRRRSRYRALVAPSLCRAFLNGSIGLARPQTGREISSPLLMTESVLNQMSVTVDQNQRISEIVRREQNHLQNFIRRRVMSDSDAEDVLQDVFCELVGAYRLMKPMEHATAWLYRVARNRIIDRFRKKKPGIFSNVLVDRREDGEWLEIEDSLPSQHAGPEASYARNVLFEKLDDALETLSDEQRNAFIAHELEGRSFKQMAAETGASEIALRLRKHYAVHHLRRRLRASFGEFRTEEKQRYGWRKSRDQTTHRPR